MNDKEQEDGVYYSVSEAVQRIGAPSHVLRYWEEELGIAVKRNSQGHRLYGESDVELFRWVKRLKENGIQLKAIRTLLREGYGRGGQIMSSEEEEPLGPGRAVYGNRNPERVRYGAGNPGRARYGDPDTEKNGSGGGYRISNPERAGYVVWNPERAGYKAPDTEKNKNGGGSRNPERAGYKDPDSGKNKDGGEARNPERTGYGNGNPERTRYGIRDLYGGEETAGEGPFSASDFCQDGVQYEIIPTAEADNFRIFEAILRSLMEEVVAEQNAKLEKALKSAFRTEAESLYLQFCQEAKRETAAAADYPPQYAREGKGAGRFGRWLREKFSGLW